MPAAEPRQIAARTHEGDAARRMLALAHVMDERSRAESKQMMERTLHRANRATCKPCNTA